MSMLTPFLRLSWKDKVIAVKIALGRYDKMITTMTENGHTADEVARTIRSEF